MHQEKMKTRIFIRAFNIKLKTVIPVKVFKRKTEMLQKTENCSLSLAVFTVLRSGKDSKYGFKISQKH